MGGEWGEVSRGVQEWVSRWAGVLYSIGWVEVGRRVQVWTICRIKVNLGK